MPRNHTRVHQRALGLVPPRLPRPDDTSFLPTRLTFTPEARQALLDQLYASGTSRGGPLFGYPQSGTGELIIVAAPPGGYRVLDPLLATDPLHYDNRYLLGWIDGLSQGSVHEVDWLGSWVMWPDSLLGSLEDELAWLRRGRATDLFNSTHCLCALGWADGTLSAHVYTWDPFSDDVQILATDL